MMNFLLLLLDAVGSFIRRNPIFCLVILLLAVFAPSLVQGIAQIVLYAILGIVCFWAGILLWLRWRIGRLQKRMGEEFDGQQRTNGFGGFGNRTAGREGEVKVHRTADTPEKRVSRDVGDYVDFEETKEEKK